MIVDQRWQMVTCRRCTKSYRCTPANDYYNATTTTDGVCETCLLLGAGIHPDNIVETAPGRERS